MISTGRPTQGTLLRDELLELQWAQLRHDQGYHPEILTLPVADRLKHMTLHFAKYVGHLAAGSGDRDLGRTDAVLIDSLIIVFAASNAIGLDLGARNQLELEGSRDFATLGRTLPLASDRPGQDASGWLLREFAQHTGILAKACESLDHLEAFPFRETIQQQLSALFGLLVVEMAARGMDLQQRVRLRLHQVETRNMFDRFRRADEANV